MPPCGNFGLVYIATDVPIKNSKHGKPNETSIVKESSIHCENVEVGENSKISGLESHDPISVLPSLNILRGQAAWTEFRGGQAGGISCMNSSKGKDLKCGRVRMVARKRNTLAKDLIELFREKNKNTNDYSSNILTYLGHTRFATSSINIETELHPHQWVPPCKETVWIFDSKEGLFSSHQSSFVVHISHNGDFDALNAFGRSSTVNEVGVWLERVLQCSNNTSGDSPKVAGCIDLLRVQGRWAAAARLAYIRCIHKDMTDVCDGEQLSKKASNTFPVSSFWDAWRDFFEVVWVQHKDLVIEPIATGTGPSTYRYRINVYRERQFVNALVSFSSMKKPDISDWKDGAFRSFVVSTVRGFLRMDLYNACSEFLSRAQGSFGLQMHCSVEEGVVVIASKGQPMSVSYDPKYPVCLFASEAAAVAVQVDTNGRCLTNRVDLDSKGEIIRIGRERALDEGSFIGAEQNNHFRIARLLLPNGIEIRSYSLVSCSESLVEDLLRRVVRIEYSAPMYDTTVDLVSQDLKDVPSLLHYIASKWSDRSSPEIRSAESLSQNLLRALQARLQGQHLDCVDLIISGVEASLWVAEQLAQDLRMCIPELVVSTVSSNKIIFESGHGDTTQLSYLSHKLSPLTCVLFISQSGQTFPSLHATRTMLDIVGDKVWILVGCPDTRMEGTLLEYYRENSLVYNGDRVFRNYSGLRPAEPTSAAIAATFHTLTFLLLHFLRMVNAANTAVVGCINEEKSYEVGFAQCIFTNHCLDDIQALVETSLVESASDIVGYDRYGATDDSATHKQLVTQGRRWAAHINEPWHIMVIIGCYIIISVGLNLTVVRMIADAITAILVLLGFSMNGKLIFGYNYLDEMRSQAVVWTVLGLVVQLGDALVFVYLAKLLTPLYRIVGGRPLWARLGKRTLVVVDVPWVHQLVHQYVSKLFSESYSFVSIDVHGADGLDHFVHCYTHRVVRGLLIAVGRPDGRLHGLAKYESAVLLSSKQAAFIRNPRYNHESAGPEFVTVGHNSFQPSMGLATHIVLPRKKGKFIDEILYGSLTGDTANSDCDSVQILSLVCSSGKDTPFSKSIYGKHFFNKKNKRKAQLEEMESLYCTIKDFIDFSKHSRRDRNDPALRMSFSASLDKTGRSMEAHNAHLHLFYERRVASLERFVAFCVMFHAMAEDCKSPWLCNGWNTARSQSNLRVATTASPVTAEGGSSSSFSSSVGKKARLLLKKMRGWSTNF